MMLFVDGATASGPPEMMLFVDGVAPSGPPDMILNGPFVPMLNPMTSAINTNMLRTTS
ncbi:MAG TPA: hypothetical protein VGD01_05005 [Candidatus Elarobacter sp.]|jgi:hypothetical protein